MKFKRVYHPVNEWEEVAHNMWGEAYDNKIALDQAIAFTSDHKKYGHYMRRVAKEWPISCENALTDPNLNKKAWIGHAAVALALNIPEDITRKAWGFLTDEQCSLANEEARRAIREWENTYAKDKGLHKDLGKKVLQKWCAGSSAQKTTDGKKSAFVQGCSHCNFVK